MQDDAELMGVIMAQMDEATTMTLAVAGRPPHAAAVFHARDGDRLVFVTDPGTLHGARMLDDPAVAFTIQGQPDRWEEIMGVQGRGLARMAADATQARRVFSRRFPGTGSLLERAVFWELELGWLRLIDNRRGFGFKAEFHRDPGGPWSRQR